jgi:hypothetical protein
MGETGLQVPMNQQSASARGKEMQNVEISLREVPDHQDPMSRTFLSFGRQYLAEIDPGNEAGSRGFSAQHPWPPEGAEPLAGSRYGRAEVRGILPRQT